MQTCYTMYFAMKVFKINHDIIYNMSKVDLLLNAINNVEHNDIVNLKITFTKINSDKQIIIENLFNNNEVENILNKLQNYKLVDELPDLKYGSYIRWINIKNRSNMKLTNGGLLCDIKIKNSGIILTCKNRINKIFELNMGNNIIFQKLSNAKSRIQLK